MDHEYHDQMKSVEVYDPVDKCQYRILVPKECDETEVSDSEEVVVDVPGNNDGIAIWQQNETLALINIFSLHKEKFKGFKKKRVQWNLISKELAKIGIQKSPVKCEVKWKNLLRVYRQHKAGNKKPGKFEFFNELDDIIANDPQFRQVRTYTNINKEKIESKEVLTNYRKRKCPCTKNDKQKRHEDRMALMTKKLEIEERKVKAFEDYLKILKSNYEHT